MASDAGGGDNIRMIMPVGSGPHRFIMDGALTEEE